LSVVTGNAQSHRRVATERYDISYISHLDCVFPAAGFKVDCQKIAGYDFIFKQSWVNYRFTSLNNREIVLTKCKQLEFDFDEWHEPMDRLKMQDREMEERKLKTKCYEDRKVRTKLRGWKLKKRTDQYGIQLHSFADDTQLSKHIYVQDIDLAKRDG